AFALQPDPDERTKDDLEAHWKLERCCRSARDDASLIQRILRKNEKEPCFVIEHSALLPKTHLRLFSEAATSRIAARAFFSTSIEIATILWERLACSAAFFITSLSLVP